MFNPMAMLQFFGGAMNFRNQLNQFQQGLPQQGFDPKQAALSQAQELLNSGKMTQQQYNTIMQFASFMTGQNGQQ